MKTWTPRDPMKSGVIKRSIDIGGHKTSVSLEDEFWDALREIATLRKLTVSKLAQQIDSEPANGNLSSAIRVFVLAYFQAQGATPLRPNSLR